MPATVLQPHRVLLAEEASINRKKSGCTSVNCCSPDSTYCIIGPRIPGQDCNKKCTSTDSSFQSRFCLWKLFLDRENRWKELFKDSSSISFTLSTFLLFNHVFLLVQCSTHCNVILWRRSFLTKTDSFQCCIQVRRILTCCASSPQSIHQWQTCEMRVKILQIRHILLHFYLQKIRRDTFVTPA